LSATCWPRRRPNCELLYLPRHIFGLLAAHADDEHADRHAATHVVHVDRGPSEQVLVNGHPMFRQSAFITANANEPRRGEATLRLVVRTVRPLPDHHGRMKAAWLSQPPGALAGLPRLCRRV
jgi:hypothetical protein